MTELKLSADVKLPAHVLQELAKKMEYYRRIEQMAKDDATGHTWSPWDVLTRLKEPIQVLSDDASVCDALGIEVSKLAHAVQDALEMVIARDVATLIEQLKQVTTVQTLDSIKVVVGEPEKSDAPPAMKLRGQLAARGTYIHWLGDTMREHCVQCSREIHDGKRPDNCPVIKCPVVSADTLQKSKQDQRCPTCKRPLDDPAVCCEPACPQGVGTSPG